jgi:hypothetical protein
LLQHALLDFNLGALGFEILDLLLQLRAALLQRAALRQERRDFQVFFRLEFFLRTLADAAEQCEGR